MMSRSMVLVCLLLILVFTSQFDWKQQTPVEIEATSTVSRNQQQQPHPSNREEDVKEKIILSQERHIQNLNKLVHNLQEQLNRCKGSNSKGKDDINHFSEIVIGHDAKHTLEN